MTVYEHTMLGATLALATGAQRRQGWGLVVTAAVAAALPDWDGLALLFGPTAYSAVHRTWGHNLLTVCSAGMLCGAAGYLAHLSARVHRGIHGLLGRLQPGPAAAASPTHPFSGPALGVWLAVSTLAALTHLPCDLLYGGGPGMSDWPLKLLWPFSSRTWAWSIVPWGDLGATVIFIVEMFALYRWPRHARGVAWVALLALVVYLAGRWVTK